MASKNTVTINGRAYDATTGLPVEDAPLKKQPAAKIETPKAQRTTKAAASVHSSAPQRSQTLRRTAVKKPVAPTKIIRNQKPSGTRHMDIARSTQVTKFAPHPEAAAQKIAKPGVKAVAAHPDRAPQAHPVAKRTVARQARQTKQAVKATPSAKAVKNAQIEQALTKKQTVSKESKKATKKSIKKNAPKSLWKRRTILLTGVAVLALLATIAATHIFPGLSVQVASIRSGVQASYPTYIPDGYSLKQPIEHENGKVAITFKSNSNATSYTLTQSSSTWDSTAVLDTLVKKKAENNYVTTKERGLTIFTYQTNAAWVNAGTLFTIEGDADLSGDQIRKIATSL